MTNWLKKAKKIPDYVPVIDWATETHQSGGLLGRAQGAGAGGSEGGQADAARQGQGDRMGDGEAGDGDDELPADAGDEGNASKKADRAPAMRNLSVDFIEFPFKKRG